MEVAHTTGATTADWIMAAVLILSMLLALKNGLLVELFALIGLIAGLQIASVNYVRFTPWLFRVTGSLSAAEITSFLLIALGVMLLAGLLGRLLRGLVTAIGLGPVDSLLGAIFGLLRGALIVTVGVLCIAAFWPQSGWLRDSHFAPYFLEAAHRYSSVLPFDLQQRVTSGSLLLRQQ